MNRGLSRGMAWALTSLFLGGGAVLVGSSLVLYDITVVPFLLLLGGYFLHGLTFTLLMLVLSILGLRQFLPASRNSAKSNNLDSITAARAKVSVAIPVFNEAGVIQECVDSIHQQSLTPAEIIVINDGSTDDTLAVLQQCYALYAVDITLDGAMQVYHSNKRPNLRVIDKPNEGKAEALNAALQIAQGEFFITVDADSFLHPQAMERLVVPLVNNSQVIAVGGMVKAANGIDFKYLATDQGQLPQGWLPQLQWVEYATGFIWRFGWAYLNTLLLLSGSFSAFRTSILRQCQGFDKHSITEDYEMAYRLHAYHLANNIPYEIVTVPNAVAYTLVPETVRSLVRQRVRWFQGFLETLLRYRHVVLDSQYGTLGIFMLPIKCVDAIAPAWALIAYALLIGHALFRPFPIAMTTFALLLGGRMLVDILMFLILLALHQRSVFPPLPRRQVWQARLMLPIYFVVNQLLWQVYGLWAYYRLVKRVKRWEKVERKGFVRVYSPSEERN
jgi:cellulose synthase/poly-beta-1,6-N-acetylglucosamine synthase-like glycosyltransferase